MQIYMKPYLILTQEIILGFLNTVRLEKLTSPISARKTKMLEQFEKYYSRSHSEKKIG